MDRPSLADVIARHAPLVLALPGITGLWEGRGEDGSPCLVVGLVQDDPRTRSRLATSIEGYPVRVEVIGEIGPHQE